VGRDEDEKDTEKNNGNEHCDGNHFPPMRKKNRTMMQTIVRVVMRPSM
jgi:hypothetical protein